MPLCKVCESCPFFNLPLFPQGLTRHFVVREELLAVYLWKKQELGFEHYRNLDALVASADTCAMCRLIQSGVLETAETYKTLDQSEYGAYLKPIGAPSCHLWLCGRPDGAPGFVVLSPGIKNTEVFLVAAAGFCVDDESRLVNKFPGRPVDVSPRSKTTLDRVQGWIRSCTQDHGHVGSEETELPKRLVDLGDSDDEIRLREFDGESGVYACLSHCWGTARTLRTTRSTFRKRLAGIKTSDLPQTFRDAIWVARKIGIRFLWIDSLCIVQDDTEDWEHEASQMASIYTNAFITIAATRAAGDNEGFLGSRRLRSMVQLWFTHDGVQDKVFAFPIPAAPYASESRAYLTMSDEPLVKRGWTLQERYLAPRTLHFGQTQLSFECPFHFITEDGYISKDGPDYLGTSKDHVGPKWSQIIEAYTPREFTKPMDRLPALIGLANAFNKVHSGSNSALSQNRQQYLAGIWRDDLIKSLCWQAVGESAMRATEYRAPTWSWASLDGTIARGNVDACYELAAVEDVQVKTRPNNPYGAVSGGWARLRIPSKLSLQRHDRTSKTIAMNFLVDGKLDQESFFMWDRCSEVNGDDLDKLDLWILPMLSYNSSSYPIVLGLLVFEKNGDEKNYIDGRVFERLGCVCINEKETVQQVVKSNEEGKVESVILV